jgi:hypothetical protein
MDWVKIFELFSIMVCCASASYAMSMAIEFRRVKHGMGKAVSIDKFAEAVNQGVLFVFATAYMFELFVRMPVTAAVTLRLIGSLATLLSSINLKRETKKAERETKKVESESE